MNSILKATTILSALALVSATPSYSRNATHSTCPKGYALLGEICVSALPKLPEIHARAETLRDSAIAAEDNLYCGKLGMGPDSPMHRQCISYLQDYRATIEQRHADDNLF